MSKSDFLKSLFPKDWPSRKSVSFMEKHEEIINVDKLQYCINNFDDIQKQMNRKVDPSNIEQKLLNAKKMLARARPGPYSGSGIVHADYRQNFSAGRYFAVHSISLQSLMREIRHTIARDYYTDIDMVNAHPCMLKHLCEMINIPHPLLTEYVQNRNRVFEQHFNGNSDIGKVKILKLMNGDNLKEGDSKFLEEFKYEMDLIHRKITFVFKSEFASHSLRRENNKEPDKFQNNEGSFMNCLLCILESKALNIIMEALHADKHTVPVFDGLMLTRTPSADELRNAEKAISDKMLGMKIELKIKPMDSHFNIPSEIATFKIIRLDSFFALNDLVAMEEIYPEWALEWSKNINIIENNGEMFFAITSNKVDNIAPDYEDHVRSFNQVKLTSIKRNYNRLACKVINPLYVKDIHDAYESLEECPKEFRNNYKYYVFETIGWDNNEHKSLIHRFLTTRFFNTYSQLDWIPISKLSTSKQHNCSVNFNTFVPFPFEEAGLISEQPFLESHMFKHLSECFFDSKLEVDNMFDTIADILQNPANNRAVAHILVGPQGNGKDLFYHFLSRLIGQSNCCEITDSEAYFSRTFNMGESRRLLKFFQEMKAKGAAFSNHDKLKSDISTKIVRVEPKGFESFPVQNFARVLQATNHKSDTVFYEQDDRRLSPHLLKTEYARNKTHFAPLWAEINNKLVMHSAFSYFMRRHIEDPDSLLDAIVTKYKCDQKLACLPKAIKFLLTYIEESVDIGATEHTIHAKYLKQSYREHCEENGSKYNGPQFQTQLSAFGIVESRPRSANRERCYKINLLDLQSQLQKNLGEDFKLWEED